MQVYCGGPMSNEAERQLRDTSDAVMRDLEALSALEEEKRALHPGDPRLLDFATRIRSLADRLLKVSADEQARVLSVERGEEAPPTQSIEQTPPRSIQLILAEWRDAERSAGEAEPGSPEAVELERVIVLLRDEYRRAHEAASEDNPAG